MIEMAVVLMVISLIVAGIASGRKTITKAKNTKFYQRNVVSCVEGALAGAVASEITLDTGWSCEAATELPDPSSVNLGRVLAIAAPGGVDVDAVFDISKNSMSRTFGEDAITVSGQVITIVLPVDHNLGGGAQVDS